MLHIVKVDDLMLFLYPCVGIAIISAHFHQLLYIRIQIADIPHKFILTEQDFQLCILQSKQTFSQACIFLILLVQTWRYNSMHNSEKGSAVCLIILLLQRLMQV